MKTKYFHSIGTRNWVFSGEPEKGVKVWLVYTMDTEIRRHIKIKAVANQYLPVFEMYFEQRLERLWKSLLKGRDKLLMLWLRQQKRYPMCSYLITKETGWNIHHVVERVNSGSDRLVDLVLLHPNCHRQLHNLKCF